MTTIRWAIFLPAALIASVVAGTLGTAIADFMGTATWCQHLVSGCFSGAAMMLVGARIAPRPGRSVKWVLITLLVVLGALSAAGGLLGPDRSKALIGLAMLITGFSAITLTPSEIAQNAPVASNPASPDGPSSLGSSDGAAQEPMNLWHHIQEPDCAAAEVIVRRYGAVLDNLGATRADGLHEFIHGWPEHFLPFPKAVIHSALLRYTRCLVSVGRLTQEKREALRGGYGATAWFVPEEEAMQAAWVAQVQISGSADEQSALAGTVACEAAYALFDRALGECIERRKEYDEFVKLCEEQDQRKE